MKNHFLEGNSYSTPSWLIDSEPLVLSLFARDNIYNFVLLTYRYLKDNLVYIDKDKLAIYGKGMGGHLVVNLISHSSSFTCGVAVAPVTSWRNFGTFSLSSTLSLSLSSSPSNFDHRILSCKPSESHNSQSFFKFLNTEHVLFRTLISFWSRKVSSNARKVSWYKTEKN